jgi:sterol desaturase/sphingolipid hydroxylase (fatty acid hydroxylase superfamily)
MSLENFILFAPFVTLSALLIIERCFAKNNFYFDGRDKAIIQLELILLLLSLLSSTFLMLPFVNLVAPLQMLSLANLPIPRALSFILSFLLIDLIFYFNHRLHHSIPLLWKLHRLHHSDRKVDALTTFLHHPLESLSTFLISILLFVIFDLPVPVILIYFATAAVHGVISHSSILIPEHIDRYLRYFIITPNAHRLHHSIEMKEGNSNFGALFLFWDFLFGTYVYKVENKVNQLTFGINLNQTPMSSSLNEFLINPVK